MEINAVTLDKQLALDVQRLVRHFRNVGLFEPSSVSISTVLTETPVYFSNDSGEIVPAYACMQVTGTLEIGGQNYLVIEQPADTDGTAGPFIFNGPREVEIGGEGVAQNSSVLRVFKNTGTVTAGYKWGATVGEWYVTKDAGSLIVCGEDDIEDDVFRVIQFAQGGGDTGRFVLTTSPTGGATGPTGAYMTATATIYKAETDGSVTSLATGVTLYLDYEMFGDLEDGDYGYASKDARGKWIAVNAPCAVAEVEP